MHIVDTDVIFAKVRLDESVRKSCDGVVIDDVL